MTRPDLPGQRQMFAWIEALPDQLAASGGLPGLDSLQPLPAGPWRILCCGMGGSATAAGLLADGWPGLAAPIFVWRDDGLPEWADPHTLVIASSYSGDTAETLGAVAAARRRGCPVVALTSGGALLAQGSGDAGEPGFPVVHLPGGQPPRTALGASLGALLHGLHRLGLLADPTAQIEAACSHVRQGPLAQWPHEGCLAAAAAAAALAQTLAGRFTVIYTAGQEAHGAGRRLLTQLQENAKSAGHVACFPELVHNEIVGWNLPAEQRDRFALLVLRGGDETAPACRRVAAALELLADQFPVQHQIVAWGPDRLSRVLGLLLFGDWVSAHLAVARGVDPVPIARIDALKSRLAGR